MFYFYYEMFLTKNSQDVNLSTAWAKKSADKTTGQSTKTTSAAINTLVIA